VCRVQDLISFMLEETVEGRASAAELLDHPWLSVCVRHNSCVVISDDYAVHLAPLCFHSSQLAMKALCFLVCRPTVSPLSVRPFYC